MKEYDLRMALEGIEGRLAAIARETMAVEEATAALGGSMWKALGGVVYVLVAKAGLEMVLLGMILWRVW
jgi:hypothetical protein